MKRLLTGLTALVLIASISAYTHSQKGTVRVHAGFMKGNDYLELDASEKRAYAMGAVNGMLVAPLLGAPEEKLKWLQDCTLDMNDEQVAAIITKYLRDNPAKWHFPMNLTSFNAMKLACPNSPKS
jgi:hypothetical protein